MIKPRRIGHATFETPDLDRMIDYYTEVLGLVLAEREKDRAFLATQVGLLAIQLNKAERRARRHAVVRSRARFRFRRAGARTRRRTASRASCATIPIPGLGPMLTFHDNKGTTIALFKDWSYLGKHLQHHGVGPLKLGHIAWVVEDPAKTAEFYRGCSDFKVSDWIDDFFVFMRCNTDHHTVNFIRGTNSQNAPHGVRAEGLHPSAEFLRSVRAEARSRSSGVRCGTGRGTTSPPITAIRTIRSSSSSANSTRWWTRSSAISSRGPGIRTRRSGRKPGKPARPPSGARRRRRISTAPAMRYRRSGNIVPARTARSSPRRAGRRLG